MSKFGEYETQMQCQEHLVKALQGLGFKPQVHEEPVNLKGYQGDTRKEKATVVVPKSQIGRASNDLGFLKAEDGNFAAVISEYDRARFNDDWMNSLKAGYTEARTMAVAEEKGYIFNGRQVMQTATGPVVQLQFMVR